LNNAGAMPFAGSPSFLQAIDIQTFTQGSALFPCGTAIATPARGWHACAARQLWSARGYSFGRYPSAVLS